MDINNFYNREAEKFTFLKVPEILVDGKHLRDYLPKQLSFIPCFLNEQECPLRITG